VRPRRVQCPSPSVHGFDSLAEISNESHNSLVERLLGEALRLERHSLLRFRSGASGRREPYLTGTRLLVRQVVAQLGDSRGAAGEVADYLGIERPFELAARDYYADFGAEIDVDEEWAASVEASEHARWERQQAALA
jgi:hypothetical protein